MFCKSWHLLTVKVSDKRTEGSSLLSTYVPKISFGFHVGKGHFKPKSYKTRLNMCQIVLFPISDFLPQPLLVRHKVNLNSKVICLVEQ